MQFFLQMGSGPFISKTLAAIGSILNERSSLLGQEEWPRLQPLEGASRSGKICSDLRFGTANRRFVRKICNSNIRFSKSIIAHANLYSKSAVGNSISKTLAATGPILNERSSLLGQEEWPRLQPLEGASRSGRICSDFRFGIADRRFVRKISDSNNRFSKIDNRSCKSLLQIGGRRFHI